ncbi:MAG: hypothetical protein ABUT39_11290, partial [Acidobacteriota bacterium]
MRFFLLAALLGMAAAASLASTSEPLHIDNADGGPGYVHEVFTLGDGLPRAGLNQTLRTRDGYLWLATFDGLVRFDGVRFEVFDIERVPALGSNRIADLVETRDGALWIHTEQGHVARYAGGVFTSCARPRQGRAACDSRESGDAWYTLLTLDDAGALWLSGPSGLLRWEDGGLREVPGTRTGSGARTLIQDQTGRLWAGSGDGVWYGLPGKLLQRLPPPAGWDSWNAPSLAEDGAGGIWIATFNGSGRLREIPKAPGEARPVLLPQVPGWGYVVEDGRGEVLLSTPDRLLLYRGFSGRPIETVRRADSAGTHRLLPGRSLRIGPDGEEWIAWRNTLYRDGVPV